jgi:hypothetical protein
LTEDKKRKINQSSPEIPSKKPKLGSRKMEQLNKMKNGRIHLTFVKEKIKKKSVVR